MKEISVHSEHAYTVKIGCNWRDEISKAAQSRARVAIVVTSALRSRVEGTLATEKHIFIFEIPDSEAGKSARTLQSLWAMLGENGFTRSDLLVAVGGGATTDIAGFAAATWLRGIDWIAVPTTLAGMVDAAVGGKTGLNTEHGKNLVGAFHSPIEVLVDTNWLQTLSDRDFAAGLAEVIKCGFIADREILTLLSGKSLPEIRAAKRLTEELIERAISIKAQVVSEDFKEGFAREVLNYGHTMGHAIELHSGFELRHGEAVAIGMVYVAELARIKGVLSEDLVALHRLLLSGVGLPTSYSASAWSQIRPTLSLDKKARGHALRFVAISNVGKTLRLEDVSESELAAAYERVGK